MLGNREKKKIKCKNHPSQCWMKACLQLYRCSSEFGPINVLTRGARHLQPHFICLPLQLTAFLKMCFPFIFQETVNIEISLLYTMAFISHLLITKRLLLFCSRRRGRCQTLLTSSPYSKFVCRPKRLDTSSSASPTDREPGYF